SSRRTEARSARATCPARERASRCACRSPDTLASAEQRREQLVGGGAHGERFEHCGADESCRGGVLQELQEGREVAVHVAQADRLVVQPELAPGHRFEQLVQRPAPAGRATNPSESAAITALRSCSVFTM